MTTSSTAPLLPLLVAAGVGFLGGAVGGVAFAGARTLPPSSADARDLTALVNELRGLRHDLQGGIAPATADPGRPVIDRQPAMPASSTPDLSQLTAVVTQLVQAVETLATRADALGAQQAAQRGVLEQVARRSTRDVPALVAVSKALRADHDAAQSAWMFTPATEVLRRFGPPVRIGGGKGGLQWEYSFDSAGEDGWIGFTIADGYVVSVN